MKIIPDTGGSMVYVSCSQQDSGSSARKTGQFRYFHGLSVFRLLKSYFTASIGFFLVFDPFIFVFSLIVAHFIGFYSTNGVSVNNVMWVIFLALHSMVFFIFLISSENDEYDESYCEKCATPWGYQITCKTYEEDTDKRGIPLFDGRKMIHTTRMFTCRYCGDYWEESTSHVYDPAVDNGGE